MVLTPFGHDSVHHALCVGRGDGAVDDFGGGLSGELGNLGSDPTHSLGAGGVDLGGGHLAHRVDLGLCAADDLLAFGLRQLFLSPELEHVAIEPRHRLSGGNEIAGLLGQQSLRHEGAHGVGQQDDRKLGVFGGDRAIDAMQVVDRFPPGSLVRHVPGRVALSNARAMTPMIVREDEMQSYLPALARQVGYPEPQKPGRASADNPIALGEIYDEEIEALVSEIYQRDYMMFGFKSWG